MAAGDISPFAITPSWYHAIFNMSYVCLGSLPITNTGTPSFITPAPFPHTLAEGLLCMLLVTGVTLDSTPPQNKNTPDTL